ncbi:M48 family metallopeptidase [Billgrantia saliphila]|uniref:M48 family metallopeptidase n=1 Tax=Billgrantia saliphila TaxID=1848458 RepID=UPI000CE56314|nr:M48 family metallopeptidase [Halomonas saliphila]
MDFFGAQARARRLTLWLVALLIVAVLGMVAAAVLVVALATVLLEGGQPGGDPLARVLDPRLLGGVIVGVLVVIVSGSLIRHFQLRAGGAAVAEALGGRPINGDTRDAEERRLLNVVEEMAIAAGLPVPAVYVLPETAINAFAAGHTTQDAAIGVTRGAIQALTRDELQGVIAHEFSHVLHGDMRLNMRLIALLYGILVIGLVGRMLLRGMATRRVVRGSRRGNGHVVLLAAGVALMVVGFVGTLCGNLIKAAVSRQREYLADASAVQYTRNPAGLADALKRVAAQGSELRTARAEEFSHLFFGSGSRHLSRLTATHPPLETRIRRLDPEWNGHLPEPHPMHDRVGPGQASHAEDDAERRRTGAPASGLVHVAGTAPARRIGEPRDEDLRQAHRTLSDLDRRLLEAAHEPYAARALVYGILMGADPASRARQRQALIEAALPEVLVELDRLMPALAELEPGHRLPLIELALPVLRQLATTQYARFRECLARLMAAENEPGMLQWALHRLVMVGIEGVMPKGKRQTGLEQNVEPIGRLLSSLALAGEVDVARAREAFRAAAVELGLSLTFCPEPAAPQALDRALAHCSGLGGDERKRLVNALACCVSHDGCIAAGEAEALRTVAWSLECPLPIAMGD